MAQCCGARRCTCTVTAGPGITVTGDGGTTSPYVISADSGGTVSCDDVRACLSAGDGIAYDPGTGVIEARTSTDAGNTLEIGTDGGLMVPPSPAAPTGLGVADTPTVDLTLAGTGTPADPYSLSADVQLDPAPPGGGPNLLQEGTGGLYVECDDVRGCLSAGDGVDYDPATGVIGARPSTDAGNALGFGTDGGLLVTPGAVSCDDVRPCLSAGDGAAYTPGTGEIEARLSTDIGNRAAFGTDGGLYVPPADPPSVGCGLDGDGTPSTPLIVATSGVWPLSDRIGQPFACDDTNTTSEIYCAADGTLHSRPEATTIIGTYERFRHVPTPGGPPLDMTPGQVHTFTQGVPYANPSQCRRLHTMGVASATVTLTVGAGAHWRVYMSPVCSVNAAPLGLVVFEDVWNGPGSKPWVYTASGVDHEFNMPPGTSRIYQFRMDIECVAGPVSFTSINGDVRYHGTTI